MDYQPIINVLMAEREKLVEVIEALEQLHRAAVLDPESQANRRGRKSMSPDERQAVSERMKRYWERRAQQSDAD